VRIFRTSNLYCLTDKTKLFPPSIKEQFMMTRGKWECSSAHKQPRTTRTSRRSYVLYLSSYITNSTDQSHPSKDNSSSASQVFLILWDPRFHWPCSQQSATCPYSEPYKSSPRLSIKILKVHFNIILPTMPRYFK
jgi:hypothetical protein